MFANVLRLRTMGVLMRDARPPVEKWASGIFEFSRATTGNTDRTTATRRLVLRHAMANPDKGVIFELYRPELIDVMDRTLRFRGIEAVRLGGDECGAMVQEWLVVVGA